MAEQRCLIEVLTGTALGLVRTHGGAALGETLQERASNLVLAVAERLNPPDEPRNEHPSPLVWEKAQRAQAPPLLSGLLPIEDFAAAHGVCIRTVERWRDRGQIVVRKVGNTRLVDTDATIARIKGEDRPARRRRTAWRPLNPSESVDDEVQLIPDGRFR